MLGLDHQPLRRRPSLTPMIDVVFLLLVFFMLAAKFGMPQAVPLSLAGGGASYSGPPRLLTVLPDGLLLNGVVTDSDAILVQLPPLMDDPTDLIVLRSGDGTDVQRLVTVLSGLRAAGLTNLAVLP